MHYEGDTAGAYTDVYSRMYPSPAEVAAICASDGPIPGLSAVEAHRVRGKPFVLCEYAHAMGNGPGALDTYDALGDASPRHHGGFVWEWRDHGILTHTADGTPYYAYGGDFGEAVHDGNFVMDGMVLPDDTPTPGLAEFAAVNAPVVLAVDGTTLTVTNRHHTVGHHVPAVRRGGRGRRRVREEADVAVPAVPAGGSATVDLPAWKPAPDAETWVTVRAELAADARWAPAGHVVTHTQFAVAQPARPAHPAAPVRRSRDGGDAEFDERTGRLRRLFGLDVDGPRLELWRAPTDNDRGVAERQPGRARSSESRWREQGLDRLVHRVVSVDPDGPVVARPHRRRGQRADRRRHLPLARRRRGRRCGSRSCPRPTGTAPGRGWASGSTCHRRCVTPAGSAPGRTSRTPTRRALRVVGRFAASLDELNVRYSRPQETGHRPELRTLEIATTRAVRLRLRTLPGPAATGPASRSPRTRRTRSTAPRTRTSCRPRPAPTCSSTTRCTASVRPPAASTSPREHSLWPGARAFTVVFATP